MKAEGNRRTTSENLLQELLAKVRLDLDRSAYKQWAHLQETATGCSVTNLRSKDAR
jgi:hypothetical protein